jgi:hypothetical protein
MLAQRNDNAAIALSTACNKIIQIFCESPIRPRALHSG